LRGLFDPARVAGSVLLVLFLITPLAAAERLDANGCVVHFPASQRDLASRLARSFSDRRLASSRWLGIEPAGRPQLYLVDGLAEMRSRAGPRVPEWAIAVTRRDDLLVFRADLLDTSPVNGAGLVAAHEAVHQVLNHLGGPPLRRLPRWFEEGLCVIHAGVAHLQPDHSLQRTAAAGNLPTFAETESIFGETRGRAAIGYALAREAVMTISVTYGDEAIRGILRRFREGENFATAFFHATGDRLEDFEARWRDEITPPIPLLLYVVLENIELALLCFGALLVAGGYLRWRLRRERSLSALGG